MEDRSEEEIQYLRNRFRGLIRSLKEDDRFEITDLRKTKECLDSNPPRKIIPADLITVRTELNDRLYPPKNGAYSVAEVFQACVEFLNEKDEFIPSAHTIYGFLSDPQGITMSVTVSREEILEAARTIDLKSFIPSTITVGSQSIGPADLLFAMLEILTTDHETVKLIPREQCVMMPEFEELCDFHMDGDSWMHSYDFHDEYVSDRLRLQSRTLRYCGI